MKTRSDNLRIWEFDEAFKMFIEDLAGNDS